MKYASRQDFLKGFTIIETLVAISILTIAVAAPMTLATQSLSSALYARDQITAFHLAQGGVEALRSVRDGNILESLLGNPTDVFTGIPQGGQKFVIDARDNSIELCNFSECPPLRHNGELYGYGEGVEWQDTRFTRTLRTESLGEDEFRVFVEVSWRTGTLPPRSFTIASNLYKWVDGDPEN